MARLKTNVGRARRRVRRIPGGLLAAPPPQSAFGEDPTFHPLRFMAGGGPAPKKKDSGGGIGGIVSDVVGAVADAAGDVVDAAGDAAHAVTSAAGDVASTAYTAAGGQPAAPVSRPTPSPLVSLLAPIRAVASPSLPEPEKPRQQPSPVQQVLAENARGDQVKIDLPEPRRLHRNLDQNPATATITSRRGRFVDPDPLGKKTVGDLTIDELVAASEKGQLKLNKRGKITTPEVRQALQGLHQARRRVAHSGAPVGQLAQQFPELTPRRLRALGRAQRLTGTPAPLLGAIMGVESNFGQSTLPGVHSGQNFAGAAGEFQIGNGTGAAGNAWAQVADELWGAKANQHSIYDVEDAALGAGQYLQTFPSTPASKDPSTWRDAAYSYNHADWYASQVAQDAQRLRPLARLGKPPDPQALQALRVAKHNAREQGINPTPFNGDVAGGGQDFTVVRADAKGMVDWAETAVGTPEGSPKAERWGSRFGLNTETQPWCANFISNGLLRRGITELPSNPNYVPSYEAEWGKYAVDGGLAKAKPGDLVTFSGSHIGIYVGNGEMVSGNSSDAVSRTPVGSPSMVIRPPYKGGKVRVADSQLAGTTASSALGGGGAVSGVSPAIGGAAGVATTRPAIGPLTALTSPLAAGPVLPSDLLVDDEEGQPGTAEALLALLGEEPEAGLLPRRRALL